MKVSNKSSLLSVLAITTLLSSSMAMAQLRPGEGHGQAAGQPQAQQGLTPGQVANDDRSNMERDRDRERQARDEQRRQEEERHIEAERMRRRAEEEEIRQQRANFERQQRQYWLEEQRQAALRQGSAKINFTNVTRKSGGEWLRVILAQPMQLSSIEISILTAAARTHQIVVHAENGQAFTIATNPNLVNTINSGVQLKDLRGIANRITAIDLRVESMGAKAIVNVEVNSLEGVPSLSQQRFAK